MKNCFLCFLAIIGTVIGSGFVSGKEIVVFFSRFGWFSFPCIVLSFFVLFFLFNFILKQGSLALKRLKNSKFAFVINIILCIIFSSAMFGAISDILSFKNNILNFSIFFAVIILSILVLKKGIGALNKINSIFVPFMAVVFFVMVLFAIKIKPISVNNELGGLSFFYSLLYCLMNTSNGCVMMASFSQKLTSKQKTQVAFYSALVLSVLLMIANIVLLQNPNSFKNSMPILSLFNGFGCIIVSVMVFIGCLTTLLTLIFTLSDSMRSVSNNQFYIFVVSLFIPLLISLLGFNFIVEYLYPFASVLGVFLLYDLFFYKKKIFKIEAQRRKV